MRKQHPAERLTPALLSPADRRLLDEVRARAAHAYARILPWQAARMLTIIDKFAADRRTGATS